MTTQNGHDWSQSHDNVVHFEDPDELSAVPPHSSHAEEAVLGSVLKRGLAIAEVLPFLKPHHFYERRHGHICAAISAPFERAAAIDYHTIAEEVTHQGTYESTRGLRDTTAIEARAVAIAIASASHPRACA
jgi:replicative DNA helicase